MIISVDHKGLEWVTAVYLSQDKVGIDEIWRGEDQHEDNRKRFDLPNRLIAKTFLFRLIYGGSAYSYANDPEFASVSGSVDYWQDVIDAFYAKYKGLYAWHGELIDSVGSTGVYVSPSGRVYHFEPYKTGSGEWKLPRTKILNYPVQGLGADIVMLSRISLWNRVQKELAAGVDMSLKLINTVHDDIWLDTAKKHLIGLDEQGNSCYNICTEIKGVFDDLPQNFERAFKVPFNLPTRYEIKALTGEQIS